MPVYSYHCPDHGHFEASRPMSESAAPHACPICGAESRRVIVSAPRIAVLNSGTRRAHETNERSAHAPKSTRTHGPGASRGRVGSTQAQRAPDGSKAFASKRPWMLSY